MARWAARPHGLARGNFRAKPGRLNTSYLIKIRTTQVLLLWKLTLHPWLGVNIFLKRVHFGWTRVSWKCINETSMEVF